MTRPRTAPALLVALVALLVLLPAVPAAAATSWGWPLAGSPEVVRVFAPGPTPYSPGHRGVDLAGLEGEPVLAAGAGTVSYAGLLAGRGVVTVVHGDLRTTYEPVDATAAVGDRVVRGTPLGRLTAGHAGCPVAACLHWGLRRGEAYLDPVGLVRPGPVRLLPRGTPDALPATSALLGRRSARGALVGALSGSQWAS